MTAPVNNGTSWFSIGNTTVTSGTSWQTLNEYVLNTATSATTFQWIDDQPPTVWVHEWVQPMTGRFSQQPMRPPAQRPPRPAPNANVRALECLRSFLTEEQDRTREELGYFDVVGSSGTLWRVQTNGGISGNVLRMGNDRVMARLCAHPPGLPTNDVFLAQMLSLETDDWAFERAANLHGGWRRVTPGVQPHDEPVVATPGFLVDAVAHETGLGLDEARRVLNAQLRPAQDEEVREATEVAA